MHIFVFVLLLCLPVCAGVFFFMVFFFLCFFASEFNPTNHLSVQTLISINMFERVRTLLMIPVHISLIELTKF